MGREGGREGEDEGVEAVRNIRKRWGQGEDGRDTVCQELEGRCLLSHFWYRGLHLEAFPVHTCIRLAQGSVCCVPDWQPLYLPRPSQTSWVTLAVWRLNFGHTGHAEMSLMSPL